MYNKHLIAGLLILLTVSCAVNNSFNKNNLIKNLPGGNIYRIPLKEIGGKNIWIVDGLAIRNDIYPEFLYGGNGERYLFIPQNEIWIDHSITTEEFKYTLAHELHERNLMAQKGLSYAEAHDSSLALELKMRRIDEKLISFHEKSLCKVSPTDCDNLKEIIDLPDSIQLKNIYRSYFGKRNGIDIWIVDGPNVRRDIFPDFGFSGNDLAYHFIPQNEIWIDSEMSCEELEFSISCEITERDLMRKGYSYDDAYTEALKEVAEKRVAAHEYSAKHSLIQIPTILERDYGTGSEKL